MTSEPPSRSPDIEATGVGVADLTDAENHLIQVQAVFAGALAIAGIFLSLYLFSVGSFRTIASFYAGQYLFQSVFFIIAGYLLRYRSTKYLIRVGSLVLCILYMLLVVLGPDARHFAFLLGALSGIGEGILWPGINLSEYIATHNRTRNLYYGKLFFLSNLASVIGLPLSGLTITVAKEVSTAQTGYYVLFGILIAILLLTYRLGAGVDPWTGVTFSTRHMARHARNPAWKLVLAQNLLRGLWAYTLPAFSAVLLFLILQEDELSLSILSAITTIAVGFASLMAGRYLQRHPKAFLLGAIVVPVGMVGFALNQNWLGVAFYSVLILCFDPFAQNTTYKAMYDASSSGWKDCYHYIVEREIAWNTGRVLSFGGVWWVLSAGDQIDIDILTKAIATAAVLPLLVGILQYVLYRMSPAGEGASVVVTPPIEPTSH